MAIKRTFRKVIRKAARSVKRRYFKGKGYAQPKLSRMVRDVTYLKSLLNAEKKNAVNNTTASQTVAIQNGVAPGYYFVPLLPTISKGLNANNRVGNSVKLHSMALRFRAQQQASATGPVTLNFMLLKSPGRVPTVAGTINAPAPVTDEALVKTIFKVNPFTDDIDYFSSRNPDSYTDWVVLGSKTVTLRADSVTGQTQLTQGLLARKFKSHHIRWTDSNVIDEGEIYLLVRASTGDTSTSTGARIDLACDFYFYDN